MVSETRSYPYVIFVCFSVPLSFSAFASIFLFFVSASSKQKKKGVIFHLVTVSNHISILKIKIKERERYLLKFEGSFNFCRRNTTLGEP